jgi:predicted DNA-binding transcriptional regulator AlpA
MSEQNNSGEDSLTVEDAVRFGGVSQSCLYEWMRDRLIAYSKPRQLNRRQIARSDLVALLATFLVTRQGHVLSEQQRLDLVADGALTIEDAVKQGPYGRSKLFEVMRDGELEYLTPSGADRCVPRRALALAAAEGLRPARPGLEMTRFAYEAMVREAAGRGLSPVAFVEYAIMRYAKKRLPAG